MKIGYGGASITGMYKGASPDFEVTEFTDEDGARILIDTKLVVHLYSLIQFDLERRSGKTMDELFPPRGIKG